MEIDGLTARLRSGLVRLAGLAASLLAAAVVIFVAIDVLPGDPAAVVLGLNATPDALAALRSEHGFDQPAPWRFMAWIGALARGDFGISTTYRVAVAGLIGERLAVSVPLACLAMGLSLSWGLGLALLAAWQPRFSVVVTAFGEVGLAIPNFWLGLLLILTFAVGLGMLPSGGFPGWEAGWGALRALILPAIALALPQGAIIARLALALLNETLAEVYIRTAEAKGLSRAGVLVRHALPNAMVPLLALMGLQLSFLLGGSIIVENVFALPGLGRLMAQAIAQHDIITLRALIFLFAATILIVHSGVGIVQASIDPRLRRASGL
ncbi:ABC transporter permease [Candidatus Raskinella chloraquaticus]|uniref:ABC transporter permease n=1 Tax=Candidatus Raskinella chloraquaticus TaxID=1951219 RepID=UPI0026B2C693